MNEEEELFQINMLAKKDFRTKWEKHSNKLLGLLYLLMSSKEIKYESVKLLCLLKSL